MGQLIQVDFGARRGKRSDLPKTMSHDMVTSLEDYRLTFSRGWLRAGRMYARLTPEQAGDLAEGLYFALMSSKPGHRTRCESVPGLVIIGEHPEVSIQGMGRPLKGEPLHDLILDLKNFYQRRRNRAR